jgi:hypothetical protein
MQFRLNVEHDVSSLAAGGLIHFYLASEHRASRRGSSDERGPALGTASRFPCFASLQILDLLLGVEVDDDFLEAHPLVLVLARRRSFGESGVGERFTDEVLQNPEALVVSLTVHNLPQPQRAFLE